MSEGPLENAERLLREDLASVEDVLETYGAPIMRSGDLPDLIELVEAVSPSGRWAVARWIENGDLTNGGPDADASRRQKLEALRALQDVAADTIEAAESAGPDEFDALVSDLTERIRELEAETGVANEELLRTAREILDDPDARKRPPVVCGRLFWQGVVSLLAGREKAGKSTLLRWAAARASRGLRVWRDDPTPHDGCRVLYWAEERPVDVAADLERMGADLDRIHVRDMRLDPGDRFATLRRDLKRVQPDLLVVDTLATFTSRMELDPGSSSDWSPVMNRFGALAQEYEVGVALNHHARKSDGEYRDSTAIGAGVDAILELRRDAQEGENVRSVTAKARSAVPARDFKYEFREVGADGPRLELLDGSLSLEERVQRFVQRQQPCSQREVREGVRGRVKNIREALEKLSENGGPVECDKTTTPYRYSIRQDAGGTAPEPGRNRSGTGGTGNGGRSGSEVGESPEGAPPPEPQAEPVDQT